MSAPEDPAAKAYRILTETDPLWDLISPAGTAAGLLGDLPTDPHQAVMGLLATPSPAERLLSSLAPPPPDLFERGVGALEREAERRSENMDGMREELTEIKTKLEALAASKAEPEATPPTAKPGQASLRPAKPRGDAAATFNPRDLDLVIEVIPERVAVTHRKTKAKKTYTREDLLGRIATATWLLLCLFGRHYNAVPGTLPDEVKKLNSPSNRRHLGKKLEETLSLSLSPVIPNNPSALAFASITAEREGIDAMQRKTVSMDGEDAADRWLRAHDSDYDPDD